MNDQDLQRPATPPDAGAEDDQVVAERVQATDAARNASASSSRTSFIRETLHKLPGTREQVPATEARQVELGQVNATTVLMERSGAEAITAERVSMERSGARSIDAKSAQLERSGAVALSSDHSVLLKSSAVQVVAQEARIKESSVVFLLADSATVEQSRVVLFAGSATGDVSTVITARAAAILGASFAVVITLLGGLLQLRRRD
jgi:hypothetical protein